MSAPKRVVVVGGGIIGASVAWHLVNKGAEVVLISEIEGGVATPASFAWINASWGNPEFYFRFRQRSMRMWHDIAAALPGLPVQWCGGLCWDLPPTELEAYRVQHSAWGYGIKMLDAPAISVREPALADIPEQALLVEEEGALEPVSATRMLMADAASRGARLMTGTVSGFIQAGGRISGLVTSEGLLEADHIVLAAGAGSAALAATVGIDLPLKTPPGLIVHSRPSPKILTGLVMADKLHMRQTAEGRIIAGANFGGADPGDDADAAAQQLFSTLRAALKNGDDLSFDFYTVGYRPTPEDGLPIIGESILSGLYLTILHSGVTLAPIVGDVCAAEILSLETNVDLSPFRPSRFQNPV
ncbi:NAD(P)/FAD-dependent oxidoreductase [Oryzifoliimicrobium ureilyticus]|uniref:NAD(P)/FAD-dependent oxidoreductase n=1 Tax=Oryzifoliimicrobium ureilyticus TaxID=3113724 RepID=UPI0030766776